MNCLEGGLNGCGRIMDHGERLAEQLQFYSELGVSHLDIRFGSERDEAGSAERLAAVRAELGECRRCKLHAGRNSIVFGVGDAAADLMFVGEAPGAEEDAQGLPFVGRAGQLLTRIIQAIELQREQVYIANILKCRPPRNRDPEADEVAACEPFLFKQIDAIRPLIIVALGKYAAQTLLRTNQAISRIRGRFFEYRGSLLLPTFHPSYLLRNPSAKREVWEDVKKVREKLKELGSRYYA